LFLLKENFDNEQESKDVKEKVDQADDPDCMEKRSVDRIGFL